MSVNVGKDTYCNPKTGTILPFSLIERKVIAAHFILAVKVVAIIFAHIRSCMYSIIKFFLFRKDPEVIHYWVMRQMKKWLRRPFFHSFIKKELTITDPSLERTLWGLKFKHPVGLAAGFDKDARFVDELSCLGFSFIEIGTLTPRSQPGNDKPRLFRLPADKALINRMGFNNDGVKAAVERLRQRKSDVIIGGNIGRNKTTPNENAFSDYETCFNELYDHVDYFTVNVSSPNTPNLRALQDKEPLERLLSRLQVQNSRLGKEKPILLKIAPDLTKSQLDDIIEIVKATRIHGVVATNTTILREGLKSSDRTVAQAGSGGLSGLPVKDRATDVIRYLSQKSGDAFPIIAVGGIFNAADAREKLAAGATLVQIYTGFIYEGPTVVRDICKGLISDTDNYVNHSS